MRAIKFILLINMILISTTLISGAKDDYYFAKNVLNKKVDNLKQLREFLFLSQIIKKDIDRTFYNSQFSGHLPSMFDATFELCKKLKDEVIAFKENSDAKVMDSLTKLEEEVGAVRAAGKIIMSSQKAAMSSVSSLLNYLDAVETNYKDYKFELSRYAAWLPATPVPEKVEKMSAYLDSYLGIIASIKQAIQGFSGENSTVIQVMIIAQEQALRDEYEDITKKKLSDIAGQIASTFAASALLKEAGGAENDFLTDNERQKADNTGDFITERSILMEYRARFETYRNRLNRLTNITDIQRGTLDGFINNPLQLIEQKLNEIETRTYEDYLNDQKEVIEIMIEYDLSPSESCTRSFNTYLARIPTIANLDQYSAALDVYKVFYERCISGGGV